ncbi:uncharacterized protein ccp110 isoform 1-T1 [Clarias gariepinus]|uniref:centriolar coiled-coil protein of 110 kDa n=1 Tax=Clarias gariepinus TaxID=13013 RepID=UPI00234CCE2C|nr:centriolar coiled-coil protein of 110 kDa [Clarias gariepinus]
MESYEEFCLKSLARMHVESGCKTSHNHVEAQSSIRFHGSHALLPRLSDQQRAEMAEQRQRAIQREAERHTVRISSLLNRVRDVIQHVQLQKGQVDEVYQALEAPCYKTTRKEEKPHTGLFLNSTLQQKTTIGFLNRGEEIEEKETQESHIREIQIESQDIKNSEMDYGKKKEREEPVSVSINESEVHPYHFNYAFQNTSQELTLSTDQSALLASSGVEFDRSCSDLTNTTCNLFSSSTPSSLTSSRETCILNTTQPQIVNKEETQHNRCSITVNHQRPSLAPLNQSYDVGSPSLTTLRPQVSSHSEASETCIRHQLKLEQQKAACRLTAAARGFLTRRLLQTEKIKLLNKTIQDSIEVIRAFQAATHQRRAFFTMQDLQLQYRVRAQLHTAKCDVHEIFFVWPLSDRLALLQQDRELHHVKRRKAMSEQNTPCQSSVTQNSLGFMKQRMLQRTQSQNTPVFSQKLKPA